MKGEEREREKGFHDLILNFGCRRRRWRLTLSARGEIRVAQCVRRVCSCPFCAFSIVDVTLRGRYVWCLAISTEPNAFCVFRLAGETQITPGGSATASSHDHDHDPRIEQRQPTAGERERERETIFD